MKRSIQSSPVAAAKPKRKPKDQTVNEGTRAVDEHHVQIRRPVVKYPQAKSGVQQVQVENQNQPTQWIDPNSYPHHLYPLFSPFYPPFSTHMYQMMSLPPPRMTSSTPSRTPSMTPSGSESSHASTSTTRTLAEALASTPIWPSSPDFKHGCLHCNIDLKGLLVKPCLVDWNKNPKIQSIYTGLFILAYGDREISAPEMKEFEKNFSNPANQPEIPQKKVDQLVDYMTTDCSHTKQFLIDHMNSIPKKFAKYKEQLMESMRKLVKKPHIVLFGYDDDLATNILSDNKCHIVLVDENGKFPMEYQQINLHDATIYIIVPTKLRLQVERWCNRCSRIRSDAKFMILYCSQSEKTIASFINHPRPNTTVRHLFLKGDDLETNLYDGIKDIFPEFAEKYLTMIL